AVLEAKNDEDRFHAVERAYLRRVGETHGRIEIKGLQLSTRVTQELDRAFVRLFVEEPPEAPPPESLEGLLRAALRPRSPVTDVLAERPRLFLIGEPGSGKSTLTQWLAMMGARGRLAGELRVDEELLPFVVPVRSLHESAVTVAALANVAGAELDLFER